MLLIKYFTLACGVEPARGSRGVQWKGTLITVLGSNLLN